MSVGTVLGTCPGCWWRGEQKRVGHQQEVTAGSSVSQRLCLGLGSEFFQAGSTVVFMPYWDNQA